jgi:hypothetical protein
MSAILRLYTPFPSYHHSVDANSFSLRIEEQQQLNP